MPNRLVVEHYLSKFYSAGTDICAAKTDIERDRKVLVKGFATIDNVALINVEGTGMVGVHGTASAIFTTVRDGGANVIMISQASSEHSVCFAVNQSDADRIVRALNKRSEIKSILSLTLSKILVHKEGHLPLHQLWSLLCGRELAFPE